MKRYYLMFNQKVRSDIVLPEAIEIEETDEIDVDIEYGNPPEWVIKRIKKNDFDVEKDYISKDVMWFYIKNEVLFYAENGKRIIVYKAKDDIEDITVRNYLTCPAFSLILYQKGYIPVHGGAVAGDNKAVILSGVSGAGKSTMVTALKSKGFYFMSDDISALDIYGENILLLPSFPQQKLCKDITKVFGIETVGLECISEEKNKYAKRLSDGYLTDVMSPVCMIEICIEDREDVVYEEITGGEKINLLTYNIYRGFVLNRLGISIEYMQKFIKIASKLEMYRITRPRGINCIEEMSNFIIEKVLQSC